jgi:hypothetical protein
MVHRIFRGWYECDGAAPAWVPAGITLALSFVVVLGSREAVAARSITKANQIRIEYVPPSNPQHRSIHDDMKKGRALEHLQELLSPFKLPHPLLLKVAGCDGVKNAWYGGEAVTVCYELLAEILDNAAENDLPIGISRADTIIGTVLDVFLHETGHAVFEILEIPVLGRQEDAADQFSAYLMLKLGGDEARRMILGAAYQYKRELPVTKVPLPVRTFADDHSLPAQRLFSLLCIAYGADKKVFSDIVKNDLLPKERADGCAIEYADLDFAMTKLIRPHIDIELAKKFRSVWTRTITARRARLMRH